MRSFFVEQKKASNILINTLDELHIKYTTSFSNKYFNEHPHKNNLYGLSKILDYYNIENDVFSAINKEEILSEIETPFIVHISNSFAIVIKISNEQVDYILNGSQISVSVSEFIKSWSGIFLLMNKTEKSIEPNYTEHYKENIFSIAKNIILYFLALSFLCIIAIKTQIYNYLALILPLSINIISCYICYLLIQKQMNIENSFSDKICSFFSKINSCNSVLDSDASKILGTFSWSEIGLGYFSSNILMILLYPFFYEYVVLYNILALPFTLWSIWYQKFIAKQWCPLCNIVQISLWLFFFCNLFFRYIHYPSNFQLTNFIFTGIIYLLVIFLINILTLYISNTKKLNRIIYKMNHIKANEQIFRILLKERPSHKIDKSTSCILFGNIDAKNIITIITNPHCNPCAQMHKRLAALLKDNKFCIQYIFASFNKELEESSKLLIAFYLNNDINSYHLFLNDWFEYGRNHREEYYTKYPYNRNEEKVLLELQKHKEYLLEKNIYMTPTILFMGYELPIESYQIEDTLYFYNLDIQNTDD